MLVVVGAVVGVIVEVVVVAVVAVVVVIVEGAVRKRAGSGVSCSCLLYTSDAADE